MAADIYAHRLIVLKTASMRDGIESLLMFIEMGLNSVDTDIRKVAQHGGLGVEAPAAGLAQKFGRNATAEGLDLRRKLATSTGRPKVDERHNSNPIRWR
ncbi:MAG: hypothetical protein OXL37_11820 [Chloroflexota bacterium]|nr:hypothetical protein [Chloroflexota bacterium]MDE2958723.1 hypothetical protein [Chloroflexota bacterium]